MYIFILPHIDLSFYDLLIEVQVSVDSVLYVQLNEINPRVNIEAFYYLTIYYSYGLHYRMDYSYVRTILWT